MRIIDFHTHPWIDNRSCFAVYANTVPTLPEGMKLQLQEMGIRHICGSVLQKGHDYNIFDLNKAALRLRDELGNDFYTPGFHIHPDEVETSLNEIERMNAVGVRLIGELVPYMHGWDNFAQCPRIDEMNTLMDAAQKHGMILSYHTIWDQPIEPVIKAHPNMAFVAAHPGERESVERHIEIMRKYDNAFLDLSGTGIFRFGCIRHLVDQVGADRILFGTDYPICNPEMYIHAVFGERLGDAVMRKILYENAMNLLGIAD